MIVSHKLVCICMHRQFVRMTEKCVMYECPACGMVWLLENRPETNGRMKVREEYAETQQEEQRFYARTRLLLGDGEESDR